MLNLFANMCNQKFLKVLFHLHPNSKDLLVPAHQMLGFPGGSVIKNLPANAGDTGSNSGQEDLLGREMATHSSILAWEIPCTEEPGGLQSMGLQKVGHS